MDTDQARSDRARSDVTTPADGREATGPRAHEAAPTGRKPAGAVERVGAQTASDVMSRMLLTVSPDQHVLLAWELLMSAGVHHLPVVEDGRCITVLDDRLLAREWVVGPLSHSQRKIRELCSGPAPSVSPDTPIERVARMMHLTGADAVTVIKDQELVGLITVHDLVAALAGEPRPHPLTSRALDPAVFTLTPVSLRKSAE